MLLFKYVLPRAFRFFGGTGSDRYTQLHFALQSASQWREVYDKFNYKDFYWFIVDYLEGGSGDAEELLDWWDK
jgi:hypothetical protein